MVIYFHLFFIAVRCTYVLGVQVRQNVERDAHDYNPLRAATGDSRHPPVVPDRENKYSCPFRLIWYNIETKWEKVFDFSKLQ